MLLNWPNLTSCAHEIVELSDCLYYFVTMVRLSSSRVFTVVSSSASLIFCIATLHIAFIKPDQEDNSKAYTFAKLTKTTEKLFRKEVYFEPLPGTNWTLFDIRRGKQNQKKEIIGVNSQTDPLNWRNLQHIHPSAINRSSSSNILVYNRVPKCASSTMVALIKMLAIRNSFSFKSSQTYWR